MDRDRDTYEAGDAVITVERHFTAGTAAAKLLRLYAWRRFHGDLRGLPEGSPGRGADEAAHAGETGRSPL